MLINIGISIKKIKIGKSVKNIVNIEISEGKKAKIGISPPKFSFSIYLHTWDVLLKQLFSYYSHILSFFFLRKSVFNDVKNKKRQQDRKVNSFLWVGNPFQISRCHIWKKEIGKEDQYLFRRWRSVGVIIFKMYNFSVWFGLHSNQVKCFLWYYWIISGYGGLLSHVIYSQWVRLHALVCVSALCIL